MRWGIVWEIARFCSLPGKSYADLSVDLLKALATPSMTNEVGVDELWNTLATTKSDTSPEQVSTEAAFAREHEAKVRPRTSFILQMKGESTHCDTLRTPGENLTRSMTSSRDALRKLRYTCTTPEMKDTVARYTSL